MVIVADGGAMKSAWSMPMVAKLIVTEPAVAAAEALNVSWTLVCGLLSNTLGVRIEKPFGHDETQAESILTLCGGTSSARTLAVPTRLVPA